MKHLLTGVAVVAALAFSVPVGAQQANPSGGNAVGLPGPNPGGPGLTPYSSGPPPSARTPGPKTSGSNYIPPPPSASDTTSAMPPTHRHARHHVASTHEVLHAHGPKSGTDTTAQLNQAELARLQAGNFSNPAAPSGPGMAPPPQSDGMNRMPAGGRATSNPTGGR